MKVVSVSVTERGRALAARLPFEHVHGSAGATVRSRWSGVDAFVLFLATGAAVRLVAPLLAAKGTDPGVVCVDEAGRWAVALCGGHGGGANDLARRVGALLGCEPVITTATDATGTPAFDGVPDVAATGDVAGVTAAVLAGRRPLVDNRLGWPLPFQAGAGPERVVVTDRSPAAVFASGGEPTMPATGVVVLHPPSLVVGVGASTGAPAAELSTLVAETLAEAGLAPASVAEVATIDRRAGDHAVRALGLPVRAFAADELAAVPVPTPSAVVEAAVGTPSVCEAAALLAAGAGGELVVPKRAGATVTVAVARRRRPRGHVAVVGLGPGDPRHRTPAAEDAVRRAQVVVGYIPYLDLCADLLGPAQEVVRSPIGDEVVRAKQALTEAAAGRRSAVVCSGDSGVYAMASVVLTLASEQFPDADLDVEVVPGVTAALAAAAVLGAPLGHDHAAVSLSDLRTPWSVIESRLRAAAESDFVVSLYNPRSAGRSWQLEAARRVLLGHRPAATPVGVVTDAGRPGQRVAVTTLEHLDPEIVGMTTLVVVGSSATHVAGGRMVTPRGTEAEA